MTFSSLLYEFFAQNQVVETADCPKVVKREIILKLARKLPNGIKFTGQSLLAGGLSWVETTSGCTPLNGTLDNFSRDLNTRLKMQSRYGTR